MNAHNNIVKLLNDKGIRETAIRILVLQFFLNNNKAFSLLDLETEFYYSDRTTLYRTLKTFHKKGLLHDIVDGSTNTKYALCSDLCTKSKHVDLHPHFYCKVCKETTCLKQISIPNINTKENIEITETKMILMGICNVCNSVA